MASGAVVCCQLADEELVEQEADAYDCEACPVAAQMADLDADNRAAWALYRTCCNRFVVDLQAGAVLLDRLTADQDAEEFAATCERLRLIHDTVQPRKGA